MKTLNLILITLLIATTAGFASDDQKNATLKQPLGHTLELSELTDSPVLELDSELELASASFELGAPDLQSVEFRASTIAQGLSRSSTATILPGSRSTTPATSPFRARSPLFQAMMLKSETKAAGLSPELAKKLLKVLE